jgi:Spy/CpxP family protein refolding chaperone
MEIFIADLLYGYNIFRPVGCITSVGDRRHRSACGHCIAVRISLMASSNSRKGTGTMKLKWISMAMIALLTGAVASAQPRRLAGPARGQAALADYLQLTTAQIAAWQQIDRESSATLRPLMENARDMQAQLDGAINSASPDPATVGKLALSLHTARDQIRAARDAAKSRRIAVLTPEQKAKFDAMQAAAGFLQQRRRGPAMGGR